MAGNAVANGLPHEAALESLTLSAAEIWGVGDRLGSLETGKEADIVLWKGDPLELTSCSQHVLVAGKRVSLESRQTLLRRRYENLEREALPFAYRGGDYRPLAPLRTAPPIQDTESSAEPVDAQP